MSESDELGLTDDDIEKLQEFLEANRECGSNEYTMGEN